MLISMTLMIALMGSHSYCGDFCGDIVHVLVL